VVRGKRDDGEQREKSDEKSVHSFFHSTLHPLLSAPMATCAFV
jgi:hypothetical protein